jgi:phosphate transport system substrate-binding protein
MTRCRQFARLGLVLCASVAATLRADVRVVGTDLLGMPFSQALYAAAPNRIVLALAFDGSKPGLAELSAGRADLALFTATPELETVAARFATLTVAYHRVLVLAPRGCPLEQISLAQLVAIFARSDLPAPQRWAELGATGAWAEAPIAAVAPEVGVGFALEFFRRGALRDAPLRATIARYRSPAELARLLSGESRALAIAGSPPENSAAVKIIAVSTSGSAAGSATEPAFLPTPENLHSGDYPLRLPLKIAYRREAAGELGPLLRFLAGDGAAPHFEAAGLVPLPPAQRARQLAALGQN